MPKIADIVFCASDCCAEKPAAIVERGNGAPIGVVKVGQLFNVIEYADSGGLLRRHVGLSESEADAVLAGLMQ